MQQPFSSGFRYTALDGMRGIALLMVLESHYRVLGIPLLWSGLPQLFPLVDLLNYLGRSAMDMFFVLSGFLLGGILLDNKEASNYFKVFYIRRACRIFPMYFLVVIPILIAPLPLIPGTFYGEPLPAWTYLTYTQNIAMAQQGNLGIIWLAHTWSMAVEEQFYLILPVLIWVVSRERLSYLLTGLILAAFLYRQFILAFHSHGDFAYYVLLPTRAEPILLGILAALAIRNERCLTFLRTRRKVLYGVLALLTASSVLLVLGPYSNPTPFMTPETLGATFPASYGFLLEGLLWVCFLLIAVTEGRGLVSFVSRKQIFVKLGIISYAAYLVHVPVRGLIFWLVLQKPWWQGPQTWFDYLVSTLGALLITLTLASISWYFFEKRIVNWGRSFKYKSPIEEDVIDEKVVERQP